MTQVPRTTDPTILVVDDDALALELLVDLLSGHGYRVETAENPQQALDRSAEGSWDVVLSDIQMPGLDGFQFLAELREARPGTPVILMTGYSSTESAVAALRAGAFDYLVKPITNDELLVTIERALEQRSLERENRRLRSELDRESGFGELVGKSPAMNEIYALIRKIANTRSNVLITGESGTGKEIVARAIHRQGSRSEKPFVPINCTAMPEGLLESELFGHVRGAFTGAHASKKGLFETAEGGTLFLDEIGDMPLALQAKLLRVLQDREIRPVGGTTAVRIDVRIVAATHRDLRAEIAAGRFRQDLFYRLNVIPITIPPLRERPEDIPVLASTFLRRRTGDDRFRFSEHALRKLSRARWLGNARELENCIERALTLAESAEIRARDILLSSDDGRGMADESLRDALIRLALDGRVPLKELSEAYIDAALDAARGRKSLAAKILDVNRRTLYRREERIERRRALEASDDFEGRGPMGDVAGKDGGGVPAERVDGGNHAGRERSPAVH